MIQSRDDGLILDITLVIRLYNSYHRKKHIQPFEAIFCLIKYYRKSVQLKKPEWHLTIKKYQGWAETDFVVEYDQEISQISWIMKMLLSLQQPLLITYDRQHWKKRKMCLFSHFCEALIISLFAPQRHPGEEMWHHRFVCRGAEQLSSE